MHNGGGGLIGTTREARPFERKQDAMSSVHGVQTMVMMVVVIDTSLDLSMQAMPVQTL
jgi:hypothetical protein